MDKKGQCIDLRNWTKDQLTFFFTKVQQAKRQENFDQFSNCLQHESVGLLFFEPSTRTRISFEKAVSHLNGRSLLLGRDDSSLVKGESMADTFHTLYAMGIRTFVLRDASNVIEDLASKLPEDVVLINAGSGIDSHPTQGLLDAFTLWEAMNGKVDGKKIVIVGNVRHSRVARSNIEWMNAMGIRSTISGPAQWLEGFEAYDVEVQPDLNKALEGAHAVMALRIQKERIHEDYCVDTYRQAYGIDDQRLALADQHVYLLHPGPVNYGIELAHDLAYHPKNLIFTQVTNGVWTRMVLLEELHKARGARQ